MYQQNKLFAICALLFFTYCTSSILASPTRTEHFRFEVIENFDSGTVDLLSWLNEDVNPTAWLLDSSITHDSSNYSLKLTGNTWKQQIISPITVDSNAVFQIAARTSSGAKIQGIGFNDGTNTLYYAISGSTVLNLEQWIPVYQGAFSNNTWNLYKLPIADDWWSFYDYLPIITSVIYINDLDGVSNRNVWFDSILNISSDLPYAPQVSVNYDITTSNVNHNFNRIVGVQFSSTVLDLDSSTFTYQWDFGDSTTSDLVNPYHSFTVTDNRDWRITLKVTDDTGKWGLASCLIPVDEGSGTLPLTMNFIGDVMLGRRYEQAGGIIPTLGVNAIFEPTRHLLGAAADITVANLEIALTNQGTPHPTKSVVYRGNPANVQGLQYAGIDIVSLANNHTLDYGLEGLLQTQQVLNATGIIHSGSGIDSYEAYSPAFINKNGLNIAFLRSCDRTGQYNNAQPFLQAGYNKPGFAYMTPYYIGRQLEMVDGVADLKIVEMHGGSEYSLTPGSGYDKNNPFMEDDQDEEYNYRTDVPHQWDIEIRQTAIDSGADLVIVHHPHIIQALEVYNGKLIAHSLGNYTFDLDYPETMHSMILYADADLDGFSNFRVLPVYLDDYLPKPALGSLGIYTLDYLARRSTERNSVLWVDKNNVSARVIMNPAQEAITAHQNNFHLRLIPLAGELYGTSPFKLPRSGSITSIDDVNPVSASETRFGSETVWFGNFEDEGCSLWNVENFSTTDVFDGLRSALLQPSSGQSSTATFKKKLKWYDNTKKFTLHGWIKTRNATAANIVIRYFNSRTSSNAISTETICENISGTTDWTWYFKELTIPSNAYYFDLRLQVTNNAAGTVQALFDNVGLIEWTPWQNSSELAQIPFPNDYYWAEARTPDKAKSINITFTEKDFLIDATPPSPSRVLSPITKVTNHPNPFNPETSIAFSLDYALPIKLDIYNIRGQKVRSLIDGNLPQGNHSILWNGKDNNNRSIASGVYLVRIQSGKHSNITKIMMMK